MTNYKHLQAKERYLINYLLNQENKSISHIAKILNLKKYKYGTNKYQKFLNYFYKNFDSKCNSIKFCLIL